MCIRDREVLGQAVPLVQIVVGRAAVGADDGGTQTLSPALSHRARGWALSPTLPRRGRGSAGLPEQGGNLQAVEAAVGDVLGRDEIERCLLYTSLS